MRAPVNQVFGSGTAVMMDGRCSDTTRARTHNAIPHIVITAVASGRPAHTRKVTPLRRPTDRRHSRPHLVPGYNGLLG
jgi:hypothetical protein